jgi:predicted TIM-barrel fold metal-dependent hydrolase
MNPLNRRNFLKGSLVGAAGAAAVSLSGRQPSTAQDAAPAAPGGATSAPGIIDTHVNLFEWPFRTLKYRDTNALVAKLRKHRVIEAWAGSFEALFSKDISGVNARLAAECRARAPNFLIPFGSINLAWPDWQEDLRRCHEIHKMPGVRIYPGYQPFDLDHAGMDDLLKMTSERGLILQVAFGMEDPRVHHPIVRVGPVTFAPLLKLLEDTPSAKVQLLHFDAAVPGDALSQFMERPNTFMDISRLEGNGAIGRMIGTVPGLNAGRVPIERIAFGSHAPYFPLETAILKLIESPLDARQIQAIVQRNARRLLPRA